MEENKIQKIIRKIKFGNTNDLKEAKSLFENLWKDAKS